MDVLVARAEKFRHDRAEEVLVSSGEMSGRDRVDHTADSAVRAEVVLRAVAGFEERRHLLGAQTEDEDVLLAYFVADLDLRAVERADRQRAIERQLHVAGA